MLLLLSPARKRFFELPIILNKKIKVQIGLYNNRDKTTQHQATRQPHDASLKTNHMTHHSNTQSNKPPNTSVASVTVKWEAD